MKCKRLASVYGSDLSTDRFTSPNFLNSHPCGCPVPKCRQMPYYLFGWHFLDESDADRPFLSQSHCTSENVQQTARRRLPFIASGSVPSTYGESVVVVSWTRKNSCPLNCSRATTISWSAYTTRAVTARLRAPAVPSERIGPIPSGIRRCLKAPCGFSIVGFCVISPLSQTLAPRRGSDPVHLRVDDTSFPRRLHPRVPPSVNRMCPGLYRRSRSAPL